MKKLREAASQDALQAKELKRRETGMILEMAELRKSDQETKKILFEKSQETLRIYARNTDHEVFFFYLSLVLVVSYLACLGLVSLTNNALMTVLT